MPRQLQCGHGTKAVENQSKRPGHTYHDVASMRPRHEGRGEPLSSHCARHNGAMSSFNAATARRPWRTSADRLRYGRHESRFNAATARRPWRTRGNTPSRQPASEASMRPRHEGRGEPMTDDSAARVQSVLQCGHGTKAVENSNLSVYKTSVDRASMRPRHEGRGELVPSSDGFYGGGSFNAATARRPWRTQAAAADVSARAAARFNAATARRPWRTASRGPPDASAAELQCGHGTKAVENMT